LGRCGPPAVHACRCCGGLQGQGRGASLLIRGEEREGPKKVHPRVGSEIGV